MSDELTVTIDSTAQSSAMVHVRADVFERLMQAQENLRDKFATAALTGLVATPKPLSKDPVSFDEYAEMSYVLADAMMQARKRDE